MNCVRFMSTKSLEQADTNDSECVSYQQRRSVRCALVSCSSILRETSLASLSQMNSVRMGGGEIRRGKRWSVRMLTLARAVRCEL